MLRKPVLYPGLYPWYVLVASLDILFTWQILQMGGHEVNVIAARVIDVAGLPGMTVFKFASVILVVGICEYVGRRRAEIGRRLAGCAVGISCVPIAVAGVIVGRLLLAMPAAP